MKWFQEYIGKPWASPANPPETFNCGDLCRYIYKKHLNLDTLEIHVGCENFKGHAREVSTYFDRAGFKQVTDKKCFDIVRMSLGRRPCHVGIYTGEGVLHSLSGIGVQHNTLFELKSRFKMEFFRHESQM